MASSKIILFFVLMSAVAVCHANPIQERSADPEASLRHVFITKLKKAMEHKLAGRSADPDPGVFSKLKEKLTEMMGKRSADPEAGLKAMLIEKLKKALVHKLSGRSADADPGVKPIQRKMNKKKGKRSANPDPFIPQVGKAIGVLKKLIGKRSADPEPVVSTIFKVLDLIKKATGKRSADPDPHLGDVITDAVNALMNMTGKRSADPMLRKKIRLMLTKN